MRRVWSALAMFWKYSWASCNVQYSWTLNIQVTSQLFVHAKIDKQTTIRILCKEALGNLLFTRYRGREFRQWNLALLASCQRSQFYHARLCHCSPPSPPSSSPSSSPSSPSLFFFFHLLFNTSLSSQREQHNTTQLSITKPSIACKLSFYTALYC